VDGQYRMISCRMTDPKMVVGYGDSGSPVVDKAGHLVAVLFGGFWNDSTFFLARAAEDVLSVRSQQSSPDVVAFNTAERPMAFIATGVPAKFWSTEFAGQTRLDKFQRRETPASSGRVIDEVPTTAIAGQSVAVMELQGDAANMYGVGVLSMPTADGFVAFGHSYMGAGQAELPVSFAVTDTVIGSSIGLDVFKWAHPIGPIQGTLTRDSGFGCAIEWGRTPRTIPVTVNVWRNGTTKTYRHQAAEGKPLNEAFRCFVASISSVDAACNSENVVGRAQGWMSVEYSDSGSSRFDLMAESDNVVGDLAGQLQMILQMNSSQIDKVDLNIEINGDVID